MVEMSPVQAREFWKALVDNASALVTDAHTLLSAGSYGRARSLTVLAQEELGKALWIYDIFQAAWSHGDEAPRKVDALATHGRSHTKKYLEAVVFGDELAEFWGDYSRMRAVGSDLTSWEETYKQRQAEAEAAAREANLAKQRGFYVDRDGDGTIFSPPAIEAGATAEDLQTAAQVIEMLLIKDHSRMKFDAVTPYDSLISSSSDCCPSPTQRTGAQPPEPVQRLSRTTLRPAHSLDARLSIQTARGRGCWPRLPVPLVVRSWRGRSAGRQALLRYGGTAPAQQQPGGRGQRRRPADVRRAAPLANTTALDGELVVWDASGRLAFERLQDRLARRGASASRAAGEWPAHFVAFDLLRLSGTDTTAWPYRRRRAALESLFVAQRAVSAVGAVPVSHRGGHGTRVADVDVGRDGRRGLQTAG
jgi:AbiV family abortive infection protein